MKIVIYEVGQLGRSYINKNLKAHDKQFCEYPFNTDNASLAKYADAIATFIHSKINKDTLSQLENLKLICTMSSGFEHIDLEYCKEKGITICHVPEYGKYSVSEFTLGLMLILSRKISSIASFSRFDDNTNLGTNLAGKMFGVIGAGRIGSNVIGLAKALGMKVQAFDSYKDKQTAKKIGFKLVSLQELLSSSDIISMHCPLDKLSCKMINMQNINQIKKGALFINTARGGLMDTKALIYALERGIIGGAAIDVLEDENELIHGKKIPDYEKLKNMENVILTYHHAYKTKESLERIFDTTILNIKSYAEGKPINMVL